jgi:hypothetical protein
VSRFVTALRTRPDGLQVAGDGGSAPWTLRVQCAEAWDVVRVDTAPSALVGDVKRAVMAVLMTDVTNVSEYVVKLRGFEVHDESQSLEGIGARDGSTLLVIARRRRPVR